LLDETLETKKKINLSNLALKLYNNEKLSVCILIPVSSRDQRWNSIKETFLVRVCLSSFGETCEFSKYNYVAYIGYDVGDIFLIMKLQYNN
jgi:hypothetical protein